MFNAPNSSSRPIQGCVLGPALGGARPKVSPRLYGWVKGSPLFAENIADDRAKTCVERLAVNGFTAFTTEQKAIRPLVGGFSFETNGRVRTVFREIFFLAPVAILFAIVIRSGEIDLFGTSKHRSRWRANS